MLSKMRWHIFIPHSLRRFIVYWLIGILSLYLFNSYVFVSIQKCKQQAETKSGLSAEDQENLRHQIQVLERENAALKAKLSSKIEVVKEENHFTGSLARPSTHVLANNITIFSKMVTVILYQQSTRSDIDRSFLLEAQEKRLREKFPHVAILRPSEILSPSKTFNMMFNEVATKFFLFLDSRHEVPEHSSDHSIGWLLHALENIPELDFVSGSIVNPAGEMEIPCYRMLLCNWTLSQRYEFARSVGELMICENISQTFMGRTSSVRRMFPAQAFDEDLPLLWHTDFFLRAKQAGAVSGVRPEVMYNVLPTSNLSISPTSRRIHYESLLPFAHKHKVFRFRDSDDHLLDLCGLDSPILGHDICDEKEAHKVMLGNGHWAYLGTFAYPYIERNLQLCLFKVTDFLTSKKVPYSIEGGVALGAIKLRALLPWDAGDVDIFFYYESLEKFFPLVSKFARENDFTTNMVAGQIQVYCAPTRVGTKMGGLVSLIVRNEKPPLEFVQLKTNGRWIRYRKDIFSNCRKYYKLDYLQHRMYASNDPTHCKMPGHNACLPDFRNQGGFKGTGGTFKEFFCRES